MQYIIVHTDNIYLYTIGHITIYRKIISSTEGYNVPVYSVDHPAIKH